MCKPLPYILIMIKSIRHKGLKRFWTKGDASGLNPQWVKKIDRILDQIDVIQAPEDLDYGIYGFHALTGDRKGQYALSISGNWRIIFEWDGNDAINLDLMDYH